MRRGPRGTNSDTMVALVTSGAKVSSDLSLSLLILLLLLLLLFRKQLLVFQLIQLILLALFLPGFKS